MRLFTSRLWFPVFLVCGLFSCEQPVDLNIQTPAPKLVVISNFTAQSDLRVRVTGSQPVITSNETVFIYDADVALYQDDVFLQNLTLKNDPRDPYYTTSQFNPGPGLEYTIKVSASGYTSVEGKSSIPEQVDISDLRILDLSIQKEPKGTLHRLNYKVNLEFADRETEHNFYHLTLFQEFLSFELVDGDTLITTRRERRLHFDPNSGNNLQVIHYDGSILFEDTPFNGRQQTFSLPVEIRYQAASEIPGRLVAELRVVTEEYYLFHTSLSRQQQTPDQPYADPVILYNNIKNGHGIFAGYSSSVASVEVR